MKLNIKTLVLATALALPTFFAGNAFAAKALSCGTACTSANANPHGFVASVPTDCYSCHAKPTVTPPVVVVPPVVTPPVVTPPVVTPPVTPPATGNVTPRPTSHGCGSCVAGTAPGSVSAHKNVNSTSTACSVCHTSSSSSGNGGATGGSTGGATTGTITVRRTSESCGSCTPGTAPGGVSAHRNVTAATACSVCHSSGSTGGNVTGEHEGRKQEGRKHDDRGERNRRSGRDRHDD